MLLRGKSDMLNDCPGRRIDDDKLSCLSGYRKEPAVRGKGERLRAKPGERDLSTGWFKDLVDGQNSSVRSGHSYLFGIRLFSLARSHSCKQDQKQQIEYTCAEEDT